MDKAVLELRGVRKVYPISRGMFAKPASLVAVDGVDLTLRRGETLALVGESGSGKTTIARMLLGLLAPTAGQILVDGEVLDASRRQAMARRIQPIFQDPYSSLNPRKTVSQIVGLPLVVHGIGTPEERRARVAEMLDVVGLARRHADAYPNQMSGGQRQRVAIARALVMRPDVVICDEPTSALDVSVQAQILNLLVTLRREFGLTYLFISHNLAVVEHLADRVAVMYLGRLVEQADRASLFAQPRHAYTRALLASVLTPEPGLGVPAPGLGGSFPNPISPPPGCSFHPRCAVAADRCRIEVPQPTGTPGGTVSCHFPLEQGSAP